MTTYYPRYQESNKDLFLETTAPFRASTNGFEYLTAPIKVNSSFNLLEICQPKEPTDLLKSVKLTKIYFDIWIPNENTAFPPVKTYGSIDVEPTLLLAASNSSEYDRVLDLKYDSYNLARHSQSDPNWFGTRGSITLTVAGKIQNWEMSAFFSLINADSVSLTPALIKVVGYDLVVETGLNQRSTIDVDQIEEHTSVAETNVLSIAVLCDTNAANASPKRSYAQPNDEYGDTSSLTQRLIEMFKNDLVKISGLTTSFKTIIVDGKLTKKPLSKPHISIVVKDSDKFHIESLMNFWISNYDEIVERNVCFYISEHDKCNREIILNHWMIKNPHPLEFEGRDIDHIQNVKDVSFVLGGSIRHLPTPKKKLLTL